MIIIEDWESELGCGLDLYITLSSIKSHIYVLISIEKITINPCFPFLVATKTASRQKMYMYSL